MTSSRNSTSRNRTLSALSGAALVTGLVMAPASALAAPPVPANDAGGPAEVVRSDLGAAAIECETAMGTDPFYPGESASQIYDDRYSRGAAVPYLDEGFTPQGLGYWEDWDGSGGDLLLVTAYKSGEHSRIYGIEAGSGDHIGSVDIAEAHVGGIAVVGGWAFVPGNGSDRIRKYDLGELRTAMTEAGIPNLAQTGTSQEVPAASFLGSGGDTLYSGKFNETGRGYMHDYSVAADGTLTQGTKYEVPKKTQGMTVADGTFIYSTSYGRTNRSNIYTVDEGATDIDPSAKCYRAPSMSEGVTDHGGRLYVLYESGSSKFTDPGPRNDIEHLHEADVADAIDF
ncbi:hypothetical protein FB384_001998 [Prauserella sediminis]|uniref:Uncharacterized protein n=1 Tax=Prauserella sediminis TaxID=577680 RepID=A0A839XNN8_9PSEU|nr:hypothetical protein [Prauserella sediminis]MBB3663094.1 hypothetical protein [Prauserella sediminis]